MGYDLRDWANRQFDRQKNVSSKEKVAAAEREAAARATRAKTERLKALRLAKEAADRIAAGAPGELDEAETASGETGDQEKV